MSVLKKTVAFVTLVGFSTIVYALTCSNCTCVTVKGSKVCVCESCVDSNK
jgi:hypothetical protein